MRRWNQTTLGKVIASGGGKIQTGPFGSQLHASDYVRDGIPCVMPANMKGNRVDLSEIAFILPKDASRLSQHIVQHGDILYSRRGDVTQKALITKKEVGYFCGTGCLLLRPGASLDSEFLTYYLSAPVIKSWIEQQAVGATMPNLNTSILSRVPFCAPEKIMQQKIAAVLSALDSKIDCNNRINAELETMAKTLYDYWFVQFDFPDENGKPYKSSGGKMRYNEKLRQSVPEQWEVASLEKYITFQRGISYTSDEISDTGLPLINLNSFSLRGEFKYDGTKSFSGKYKKESLTFTGELVVAVTDVTRNADIIGKAFIVPDIFDNGALISCDVVKISSTRLTQYYLAQLFNSQHYHDYIKYFASGTLVLHLNLDGIRWFKTAIPPNDLLKKYTTFCEPIWEQKALLQKENNQLIDLRNWLLPMLMNGQATVVDGDAERTIVPIATHSKNHAQRFESWRDNQALAARGSLDEATLRDIFDAMDDDDK